MPSNGANGRNFDPGIRAILEELRDMRVEMRAERRQAEERAEQATRKSDERFEHAMRRSDERFDEAMRKSDEHFDEAMRQSNERFEHAMAQSEQRFQAAMREFRQDSARREAVSQKMFKDILTVGRSIVKTLNHHTRILDRIDRKLGVRGNGRPGSANGPPV